MTTESMPQIRAINARVFPDGNGGYTAVCQEIDVASFGKTAEEALESLRAAVATYRELATGGKESRKSRIIN